MKGFKMILNLEALDEIADIKALIQDIKLILQNERIAKRWLSVKEVSNYLPFSQDKIYKMIDVEFTEGEHFVRKENKLIFDKEKLDEWVLYTPVNNENNISPSKVVDDILSSLVS